MIQRFETLLTEKVVWINDGVAIIPDYIFSQLFRSKYIRRLPWQPGLVWTSYDGKSKDWYLKWTEIDNESVPNKVRTRSARLQMFDDVFWDHLAFQKGLWRSIKMMMSGGRPW